jgi:GT2 family glycosyltransferase
LLSLNGFNAELKSGGDYALSQAVRKAGYSITYAPDMIVQHPVRATLSELARKRRRVIGGRWKMQRHRFALIRWVLICLREAAGKARALAYNTKLSFTDKVKVAGILAILSLVTIVELFRIAFGGEARRA